MKVSQNGYQCLEPGDHRIHRWVIPARNGRLTIALKQGSAGFILVHWLLWFSETIEDLTGKVLDDWGYAPRKVRNGADWSNHYSATAADANSLKHSLGKRGTFKRWQYTKMRARLVLYAGCIRLGIDYQNRPDEMHSEVNRPIRPVERLARRLSKTPRGKRILAANPGQRKVIFS